MSDISIPSWPDFSQAEVNSVAEVLASNRVNYWTGQEGRQFESEFAAWIGVQKAIAVTNGTLALDLALHGLGIGSVNGGAADDEVIVTPRSFIASASCVVNAGAVPVFVDVDAASGNLSAETIEPHITDKTRAIIPVHLAGWPCDMPAIMALAKRYDIKVIEDCAQAHGASVNGQSVGSFGDVAAWSFCQDKIMTTGGEGGMVTTDDQALWKSMWSFKDHGKNWDAVYNRDHPPGFRWVHESIGTNWRMLEMQSAIGRLQIKQMPNWLRRRQANAQALMSVLQQRSDIIDLPLPAETHDHAYYRLYCYLRLDQLPPGVSRDSIIGDLRAQGIPVMHGTCSEIYREKAFANTRYRVASDMHTTKRLGETSMAFLVHPTIGDEHIDYIAGAVSNYMSKI